MTTEKKCPAGVRTMLTLRPYLYRSTFTLRTEPEALCWLLNLAHVSDRLARCRLRLAEYGYDIEYRPIIERQLADGASRLRSDGGDETPLEEEMPCFSVEASEIAPPDDKMALRG